MHMFLSKLKLLIIDEVSMVSSLNLAYIHIRLDKIFARDEWFGKVNVLFVGDILQLTPVNGAAVFEKINNKSITIKLGCITSVNIWQDIVVYKELTIYKCQKKDQVFSSMLDKVRLGCPSQTTLQAVKERVITTSTVDKFEMLLSTDKSPPCLFPTREACHNFNSEMLSKLGTKIHVSTRFQVECKEALKKINSDCG